MKELKALTQKFDADFDKDKLIDKLKAMMTEDSDRKRYNNILEKLISHVRHYSYDNYKNKFYIAEFEKNIAELEG
jgi:hypothetical protein